MASTKLDAVRCGIESFIYLEACQICGHEQRHGIRRVIFAQRARRKCSSSNRHFVETLQVCRLKAIFPTASECTNCRELDLRFRYARSIVEAKGVMLEIIHRYKYRHALWFEPLLRGLAGSRSRPHSYSAEKCGVDGFPCRCIPTKLREREFNQAERLADCLGRATEIPVNKKLLRRVEPTQTQTHLTATQRAANVAHAFAAGAGCEETHWTSGGYRRCFYDWRNDRLACRLKILLAGRR